MTLLQIEGIYNNLLVQYGALGLVIVLLLAAVIWLSRKNTKMEEDLKEITAKSIEAITLSNKVVERAQGDNAKTLEAINNLKGEILVRSCKYTQS